MKFRFSRFFAIQRTLHRLRYLLVSEQKKRAAHLSARQFRARCLLNLGFSSLLEAAIRSQDQLLGREQHAQAALATYHLRATWNAWQGVRHRLRSRFVVPQQFRNIRLLRLALEILLDRAIRRRNLRKNSLEVTSRLRTLKLKSALPVWAESAKRVRFRREFREVEQAALNARRFAKEKEDALRALLFRIRHCAGGLLKKWAKYCKEQRWQQLLKCFGNWTNALYMQKAEREKVGRALRFWYIRMLKDGLRGWRDWVPAEKRKKTREKAAEEIYSKAVRIRVIQEVLRKNSEIIDAKNFAICNAFEEVWEKQGNIANTVSSQLLRLRSSRCRSE